MRHAVFALAAAAFLLCGCADLSRYDRSVLEQHRVSPALYEKMTHRDPLTLEDIVELSKRGLPASFIVHYLHSTSQVYQLTTDDVLQLKRAGVANEVIDYLLPTS